MAKRKRNISKSGAFGHPKPRRADADQSGRNSALASSCDYVKRAIDRTENGDIDGALSDAEQAVILNPKDGDAYLSRGSARAAIGLHQEAIEDFTQALSCPGSSLFQRSKFLLLCHWDRADSKAALGNQAGAIADYDRAVELNRDALEVYYNRGLCKDDLGDYAGAIADYDRAVELGFDAPEIYFNRGLCKDNRGNHAGAIADYDRAIERNAKFAEAHHSRGQANFALKNYADAITDYGRAIALCPDRGSDLVATACYNMGLSKTYREDHENAIDDFSRFIALAPDDPDGYYQRGSCRLYRTDWDGVIADFSKAMSLNPDLSVNCYSIMGIAKGWKQDYHGALEAYESSLALDPDFAPTYYNRGITEASQGNPDSAIDNFTRALELDRKRAGPYLQRGCVKATQGDYDRAMADYDEAMVVNPDLSSICYAYRAMSNLHKGDDQTAQVDCELAGFRDMDSLLATDLGKALYSMTETTVSVASAEHPASDVHQLFETAEEEIAQKDAEIERLQMLAAEFEEEAVVERERARCLEEELKATRQQIGLIYSYPPIGHHEQAEPKTPATPNQVRYYTDSNGGDPFSDWLGQIDSAYQENIREAIQRMEQGNLGDHKSLPGKPGLFERRLLDQGLRIYFAKESKTSLLILAGGGKDDQDADIDKAMERLADHKNRRSGVGGP